MKGIVCTDLYPLDSVRINGGKTMAIRELVEGAVCEGMDVQAVVRFCPILTRTGVFLPRKRVVNGILVYDIPKFGVRYIYSKLLTRWCTRLLGLDFQFDYAVCHMASNMDAAKNIFQSNVKKYIYVVHQSDLRSSKIRHCFELADFRFARSDALKHQLRKQFGLSVDGVAYSGIPEEMLTKDSRRSFNHNGSLKFIMACSLIELKNVVSSVSAFSSVVDEYPECTLDIYGDGPLMISIRNLVEKLNLTRHVVIHGFKPRADVFRAMQKADVFLMPSAPETFGLAYLEAMAAGCIVIGHKEWGIDGVVTDGVNGFLVNSGTSEHVYQKMKACLVSECLEEIRGRSLETVKKYSSTAASRNYKALIYTALCSA